jgi:DNA-binding CsgD family transcriptional regulator
MNQDQELNNVIHSLYETILEPELWRKAVGLCGKYSGGLDSMFLIVDKNSHSVTEGILATTEFSLHSEATYFQYYASIDPHKKMSTYNDFGKWFNSSAIYGNEYVRRSEFYQDFLIPHGARYVMNAVIADSNDQYGIFSVVRGVKQKPFNEDNQNSAKRLNSHLNRVFRLQHKTKRLQQQTNLDNIVLDLLPFGVAIVNSFGKILLLNERTEAYFNDNMLRVKSGYISIPNKTTHQLQHLISNATSYPAIGGGMFLSKTSQIYVIPLPANSKFCVGWEIPLALIVIVKIEENKKLLPHLLYSLYQLSPKEILIAQIILNGQTLENYSEITGVTINTARSQLKSIFQKTKTKNQSELTLLLNSFHKYMF